MKYFFFLLLSSALAALQPYTADTLLTGKITDDHGEALIGASVKALQKEKLVRGAITDVDGNYRLALDPGTYTVEINYTGFETQRITDVQITAGKITTLNAELKSSGALQEVVITSYKTPLIRMDETESGSILTSDDIRATPKPAAAGRKERAKKAAPETKDRDATKSVAGKAEEETPAASTPSDAKPSDKLPSNPIKGAQNLFGVKKVDAPTPPSTTEPPKELVLGHLRTTPPADAKAPVEDGSFDAGSVSMPLSKPAPAAGEMKLSYNAKTDLAETPKTDLADEEARRESPGVPTQPAPRAGLLTAGEWNDLHNWSKHWTDLLSDGEIAPYETMYGFYPKNRFAVMLQNEQEFPIVDAEVKLLDRTGTVIWESRTDNLGRAELWAGMFDTAKVASNYSLVTFVDGKKYNFPTTKPFAEGLNKLKIKRECQAPKNVDIVWAVDATGSMGDEIEYLKTELLDVIGRVQNTNPDLNIRMGSVFYRDKGDDYLVKSSALTPDIHQTVDYIQQQFAGGGGDYPEAVHSALEEAIFRQPWSPDAVTRICFLVLDASPHQDPEVIESLHRSIREAARRGIRIVPVSASGIQKDTEFLMKFFGLATNGSYVFLTDHSGVGGKHLEPTTDEYKVELLNDLLVRLITEYATVETCEGKSTIRFEDPQAQNQQQGQNWQALFYPNPAADQFTLELPCTVQSVTLYDAEGKAVRKLEHPQEGANTVLVSDLAEGFYTIRILKDGRMQSGKVMVVRG